MSWSSNESICGAGTRKEGSQLRDLTVLWRWKKNAKTSHRRWRCETFPPLLSKLVSSAVVLRVSMTMQTVVLVCSGPAPCGSERPYRVSPYLAIYLLRVHYSRQHLQMSCATPATSLDLARTSRVPEQQWRSVCLSLLIHIHSPERVQRLFQPHSTQKKCGLGMWKRLLGGGQQKHLHCKAMAMWEKEDEKEVNALNVSIEGCYSTLLLLFSYRHYCIKTNERVFKRGLCCKSCN